MSCSAGRRRRALGAGRQEDRRGGGRRGGPAGSATATERRRPIPARVDAPSAVSDATGELPPAPPPPPPPRPSLASPAVRAAPGLMRGVSPSSAKLSLVRAIPRHVTFGDGTASVSWPKSEDLVGRRVDGRWELASASDGYDAPCTPQQREAFERVQGTALAERAAALRTSLDQLRVSWEVGRVQFNVRRGNCFGDAISVLGELPVDRGRQPFYVTFRGEPGLDAGGVSREFFFKAISELLDPAKGVFRVVEGSTYDPTDDFVVARALNGAEERVLTFAGRLLGKALLEGHHVPAGWNAVLLKHLMALPVSLRDDLRLLDAEISRSLELIADMSGAQLSDLALTFSVARPTLNGFEDVSLRGDGCEEVTEGNVQEFARLRATATWAASRRSPQVPGTRLRTSCQKRRYYLGDSRGAARSFGRRRGTGCRRVAVRRNCGASSRTPEA